MAYSIWQDMEEVNQNPDRWVNHGRDILVNSCKHRTSGQDKDDDSNAIYSGYCSECDISEDSAVPMMNYLYPLELKDFEESKILKVVKETNCTVLENQDSGEWFLALCGGGMDLSQDIAYAYVILETWIPRDLLGQVCKQPNFSLGSKNWKKLAKQIIKQLKIESDQFKQSRKQWKINLREQKIGEKSKD